MCSSGLELVVDVGEMVELGVVAWPVSCQRWAERVVATQPMVRVEAFILAVRKESGLSSSESANNAPASSNAAVVGRPSKQCMSTWTAVFTLFEAENRFSKSLPIYH